MLEQKLIFEAVSASFEEMEKFYLQRTNDHIDRVKKNISFLESKTGMKINKDHDKSKFSREEYIPYIYLSWYYKCKKDNIEYHYPPKVKEQIDLAVQHHYNYNRHHPEYFKDNISGNGNISDMKDEDIAEMICDIKAMSQELGGDPKQFLEKKIIPKHKFNKHQTTLMNQLINYFK